MDNRSWTPRREEEAELEPSIAAMAAAKLENDGGRGTDSEEEDGSSPRRRRRRRSSTEVEVDEVSLYLSLRFRMRISRFFSAVCSLTIAVVAIAAHRSSPPPVCRGGYCQHGQAGATQCQADQNGAPAFPGFLSSPAAR